MAAARGGDRSPSGAAAPRENPLASRRRGTSPGADTPPRARLRGPPQPSRGPAATARPWGEIRGGGTPRQQGLGGESRPHGLQCAQFAASFTSTEGNSKRSRDSVDRLQSERFVEVTQTGEDGQMGGERERAQEAEPRGQGSGGAQMSEQINTARFAPSLGGQASTCSASVSLPTSLNYFCHPGGELRSTSP